MGFSEDIRTRVLLWCDRHCCLCKRACGVNIEVHHLVPENLGGDNEIDNAMPLCFECHGLVHHYDDKSPLGTKLKPAELKARRDQVYEEFTRHLVPIIHYEITQELGNGAKRTFPDTGFILHHLGQPLPVKVEIKLSLHIGAQYYQDWPPSGSDGHYRGEILWNLNPCWMVSGHFSLPEIEQKDRCKVRVTVDLAIIDQLERRHDLLPVAWTYKPDDNSWAFYP